MWKQEQYKSVSMQPFGKLYRMENEGPSRETRGALHETVIGTADHGKSASFVQTCKASHAQCRLSLI